MAPAAIDLVETLHVGGGELPIEELEILEDPVRVDGLRDHRRTALQSPLQHDLPWLLAVLLREGRDVLVLQRNRARRARFLRVV